MACDRLEQIDRLRDISGCRHIIEGRTNEAAVLVGLYLGSGDGFWKVVLTKRAVTLNSHPGEVAFPGGRVDLGDLTYEDTALREAHEEIYLNKIDVEVIGMLEMTRTRYGVSVYPVVALLQESALNTFIENPSEVADIFSVPLHIFLQKEYCTFMDYSMVHGAELIQLRIYEVNYGSYHIQGITAAICIHVASILYTRQPDFKFQYPIYYVRPSSKI